MSEFLIYQGKTAIALAVFYLFYRMLLSKETLHRFNRTVLLGSAALSLVLPLCVISFRKVVTVSALSEASVTLAGEADKLPSMATDTALPVWPVILCSLMGIGTLAVMINTVISLLSINRTIRKGTRHTLESGETLIVTETATEPFSWMRYIVISREDYENGCKHIMTHEKAHIALRHSWDLIFIDMITALQWFNPAVWMVRADLCALHEFEADEAVLRSGADIKEYQYLLIGKIAGSKGYSIANSFSHSTLKRRITMMLNPRSSRTSAWRALYMIPLVGISLAATAETAVDYRYEEKAAETTAEVTEAEAITRGPLFNGGSSGEFSEWVLSNLKYPDGTAGNARLDISFTVSETGKLTDIVVLRSTDRSLDDEVVKVLESSPEWSPALSDGKPVAIRMLLPVLFN